EPCAVGLDVAEASVRFALRVFGCQAVRHELPRRHLEVKAQLVVDGALDARAIARDVEQPSNAGNGRHGPSGGLENLEDGAGVLRPHGGLRPELSASL